MWRQPWSFLEAFVIAAAFLAVGVVLHFILGPIPAQGFAYPLNLIGGVWILFLSVLLAILARRHNRVATFLTGYKMSIAAMTTLMVLSIIMGLTRQIELATAHGADMKEPLHALGFSYMLSTWYFLMDYLLLLVVLGGATFTFILKGRRRNMSWSRYVSFLLNHLGLYIALLAGLLGAHDVERYRMQVDASANRPEWRATKDFSSELYELPLAIELESFELEEYPPKLMIIDSRNGTTLPEGRPWQLSVEEIPVSGSHEAWTVEVLQHLPLSSPVVSQDSIHFVEFGSTGAVHGIKVRATNGKTGEEVNGWVTSGSYLIPFRGLSLPDSLSIVMPDPEPKQFRSQVSIYSPNDKYIRGEISVNNPIKFDGWNIYQLSYDQEMGRWSTVSVFELVRDPWLPVVYVGLLLMLLGAVSLFILPRSFRIPSPLKEEKL
ncbi:MAG: cytochrome c biogenesis protein ResB [Porphyromonas sp.]|nr:cytochrome c biogenesis protein ResB [Porphyromonas sp.]